MAKVLHRNLSRISSQPICDWRTLKRQLTDQGVSLTELALIFETLPRDFGMAHVTIKDEAAFEQLLQRFAPVDLSSKPSAATRGRSHDARMSAAMLITCNDADPAPSVVVVSEGEPLPPPRRAHALLIENQDCFLAFSESHDFARRLCGLDIPLSEIECVFAAGNAITNKSLIPYLQQFQSRHCMFDLDYAGLLMYRTLLKSSLDSDSTHFVYPRDLLSRLAMSQNLLSDKAVEKLAKLHGHSPIIDTLASALQDAAAKLEQESYRHEFH